MNDKKVCKDCWSDIDPIDEIMGNFKLSSYIKIASDQKDYEAQDVFCSEYCVGQWISIELEETSLESILMRTCGWINDFKESVLIPQ